MLNKLTLAVVFTIVTSTISIFHPSAVLADTLQLNNFENQVLQLTNNERVKNGLKTFNISSILTQTTHNHNNTMASCAKQFGINSCFEHQVTQVGEASTWDRIVNAGYNPQSTAENIAWGYTSPQAVFDGWMNSAGHRANILSNNSDIGCGFLDANNGRYDGMFWTCDFGTSFNAQPAALVQPATTPAPTPKPTAKPTNTPTPTLTPTPQPTSTLPPTIS